MRIAVLGGGTAGFVAAAHLTARLPEARLLHVFDSRLPTIGVGEGTTPRFPIWFEEVTGKGLEELRARCGATLKKGTRFEGWGRAGIDFTNRFQPDHLIGFHFDATDLVKVLAEHVRATRADARVVELRATDEEVEVCLEDGATHRCDYVLDGRGFPRAPADQEGLVRLDWVPTGRAMLRWLRTEGPGRLPRADLLEHTRAIARPHGWVFQIPLRGRTSCGYIFSPEVSSDAEVDSDFTLFLEKEGVDEWERRGTISFPTFARRRWFDGRVFRIGNAASFVEPLEATAIGTAIVQVRAATRWIEDHAPGLSPDPAEVERLNREIFTYVCRDSLFIAWHYACGSRWNTPFWQHARSAFERARRCPANRAHLHEMREFLNAGAALPGPLLSATRNRAEWDREVYPLLRLYRPFGNFSELNFAQVGHGIGYYDALGTPAARV